MLFPPCKKNLQQWHQRAALPVLSQKQSQQADSYLKKNAVSRFFINIFNPEIKVIAVAYQYLKLQEEVKKLQSLQKTAIETLQEFKKHGDKHRKAQKISGIARGIRDIERKTRVYTAFLQKNSKAFPAPAFKIHPKKILDDIETKFSQQEKQKKDTANKNETLKQPEQETRKPTYYDTLGIDKSATSTEIKKAYRAKALTLHPDKNKAPDANEQFSILSNAYQTLSDTDSRQKYDDTMLKSSRAFYENATASTHAKDKAYHHGGDFTP